MDTSKKKTHTNSGKGKNKTVRSLKEGNSNQNKPRRREKPKGGRTTISPPAKISQAGKSDGRVLASNIDTIELSVDIVWKTPDFFAVLKEAQLLAKEEDSEYPVDFYINENFTNNYLFNIYPHGSKGYQWILKNNEYTLKIVNREKPNTRPNVSIAVRSEPLWRKGPHEAIYFILLFLESQGGELRQTKISRLDLCVDTLFPTDFWSPELEDYAVTRASDTNRYRKHKKTSGINVGKGSISARLYDKPLEIKQKSKKEWMYDVWGIEVVPDGFVIIRTEFQLRREAIKELGINTLNTLFESDILLNVWAYCTKKWLKFQDNPGKQSHQRKTFPWWEKIQNGFNGMPSGNPAIRVKASKAEADKLCSQSVGLLSSFAAQLCMTSDYFDHIPLELGTVMTAFYDRMMNNQFSESEFKKTVDKKMAKYERNDTKMKEALELRKSLGLQ